MSHNDVNAYSNPRSTKKTVEIHSVGITPCTIASYLGLEKTDVFTSHCFRRSSATLLAIGRGDIINLKKDGKCTTPKVEEGYLEGALESKVDMVNKLQAECSKNNL